MVIPNEKIQGGGGSVDVRVFMDDNGNWQAEAERISGRVAVKVVSSNQQKQNDARYLMGQS